MPDQFQTAQATFEPSPTRILKTCTTEVDAGCRCTIVKLSKHLPTVKQRYFSSNFEIFSSGTHACKRACLGNHSRCLISNRSICCKHPSDNRRRILYCRWNHFRQISYSDTYHRDYQLSCIMIMYLCLRFCDTLHYTLLISFSVRTGPTINEP